MPDAQHRRVPATSVVTRVVKPGREKAFEEWLHGISQEAAKFPGHLSATIFRPPAGARKYTVVLQFDRDENLQNWLRSDRRREWIERVSALEAVPQHREEGAGLEHWVPLPGKKETSAPLRPQKAPPPAPA